MATEFEFELPTDANYEYLEVKGTVKNKTSWELVFETVNLDWGKFDTNKSPKGVPSNDEMHFVARGRDRSVSGTSGEIKWIVKGHPKATKEKPIEIIATFDNPAVGRCKATITCTNEEVTVSVTGKSKNSYEPIYTIG